MRAGESPTRFLLTAALAVVLICSYAAGCGGERAEKEEGPGESGTLRACVIGDPGALDPAFLEDVEDIQIAGLIFDGLMRHDPVSLELEPAMAESYLVNDDATVFTFHLRKGVKFQNGRWCTADDFAYSWSRVCALDTAGAASYHLKPVKGYQEVVSGRAEELEGVRALDDYTPEVSLSYPYADFAYRTAHPCLSPIPREVVEEYGSESFGEHPVGTGPFEFVEWRHQEKVVLRRSPDHYGREEPGLDGLVFRVYPDQETAHSDFLAGELDESPLPSGELTAERENGGDGTVTETVQGLYYLGFNLNTEPWSSSPRLRRALNYAVDKSVLSEGIMEGAYEAAAGIVPPAAVGSGQDACDYRYDPREASRLLAEAGYPGGEGLPALTLSYPLGEEYEETARALRADLAGLGLDVSMDGYTWDTYTNLIANDRISLFIMDYVPDYPIMDAYLAPLFYPYDTAEDWFKYSSPEVDDIISQARETVDEDLRLDLYRGAERKILDDVPLLPLMFHSSSRVHSERVGGYSLTELDYVPYDLVCLER
ncbi:MAG: peptide ABC transporter substrate-binding protein [Actinomycetota bacterium]